MFDFSPQLEFDSTLEVLYVRFEALWYDNATWGQLGQIQTSPSTSWSFYVTTKIIVEHIVLLLIRTFNGRHRGCISRTNEDPWAYSMESRTPKRGRRAGCYGDSNQFSGENMISSTCDNKTTNPPMATFKTTYR